MSDTEPDSAMHSGSDAGRPGEGPVPGDPTAADGGFPEESEAAARAAADDAPLPAEGGPQADGLVPEFEAPGERPGSE
jgi:hypothetical protein